MQSLQEVPLRDKGCQGGRDLHGGERPLDPSRLRIAPAPSPPGTGLSGGGERGEGNAARVGDGGGWLRLQ